jgi:4-hydroxybenzoate polyprenyltransferase
MDARYLQKVTALIRASHPGPVVAVTTAAIGYAVAIGCSRREAMRVGAAVLSGQLAIGWQNDWTDAPRDELAHRRDKPIPNGDISRRSVGRASIAAGLLCIPASLANGRRSGLVHLAAVLSAASYNSKLKTTAASFLPYAISFSLLPVSVQLSRDDAFPPYWAPATAGSLGIAAHLLNVLPDREVDRALGVLGLPQRLNRETSLIAAGVFLLLSSALVSFGAQRSTPVAATAFAGSLGIGGLALRAGFSRDDRSSFRLVLILAVVDVAQLLVFSRQKPK